MEEWLKLLTVILANVGFIYFFSRENKENILKTRKEIRDDQKHLDNRWYASIKDIEMEMKDFKEKLSEIERSRK